MTATELHVSRLAVEPAQVLTITVDHAPITAAMYRQLPHFPLWERDRDENGLDWVNLDRPLGTAWGTVILHPDEACGTAGEHWHVIGAHNITHWLVLDVVPGWATTDRLAWMLEALPRIVVDVG